MHDIEFDSNFYSPIFFCNGDLNTTTKNSHMTKIKFDPKGFFLRNHTYICMSWTMFQNVGCCVDTLFSKIRLLAHSNNVLFSHSNILFCCGVISYVFCCISFLSQKLHNCLEVNSRPWSIFKHLIQRSMTFSIMVLKIWNFFKASPFDFKKYTHVKIIMIICDHHEILWTTKWQKFHWFAQICVNLI
jgi:hypothetical protein